MQQDKNNNKLLVWDSNGKPVTPELANVKHIINWANLLFRHTIFLAGKQRRSLNYE